MGFFDKVAKGLSSGWFGNVVGGISSLYSTYSNNRNIEKSLEAQSKENEKTRQYNLQLAQQQNQWNIEQWQRANDYNDPSAQLARLRNAGLNLDMVYGQSGISNTAVSSPEMTSGAPASPVDYSSLANKRTIGDAIQQSQIIRQNEANIAKTEKEAGLLDDDLKVRKEVNQLGLKLNKLQLEIFGEQVTKLAAETRLASNNADLKAWEHSMQKKFGEKYVKDIVDKISNEAKLSNNQVELDTETLAKRIAGINSSNTPLFENVSNDTLKLVLQLVQILLPNVSVVGGTKTTEVNHNFN